MKVKWYVLVGLVVAAFLVSAPLHAASVAISDEDLAGVSGKYAEALGETGTAAGIAQGADCLTGGCVTLEEGDGNSQTGSYDWTDTHAADASQHKGANDISGANSAVQQNVVAADNAISWGAWSTGTAVVGAVTGDLLQVGEGSAVQHIGGF